VKRSYQHHIEKHDGGIDFPVANHLTNPPGRKNKPANFSGEVEDNLIKQGTDKGIDFANKNADFKKAGEAGAAALSGAAMGAAIGTAVFPGIGSAAGAVIGAVAAGAVEMYKILSQGTYANLTYNGQTFTVKDVLKNFIDAAAWAKNHPVESSTMAPEALSSKFNIMDNNVVENIITNLKNAGSWGFIDKDNRDALTKLAKLPGSRDLLRPTQLLAASAWASANATAHNVLINDLGTEFPALTSDDVNAITAKATKLLAPHHSLVPKRITPLKTILVPRFNASHLNAGKPITPTKKNVFRRFFEFLHIIRRK
jgi:hypothetical protein